MINKNKLNNFKDEIDELEKELEKATSELVIKTLKVQLRKMKLAYKKMEKNKINDSLSKDIMNKERANAVINSVKYRKAKQEYQYRLSNNIPLKVSRIAKKYGVKENTLYQWIGRYDWKNLEGFINIKPDMLDMSIEEKEKIIKTTVTNKNIVTDAFLSDLAELVKFVDVTGKGLTTKQITDELNERGHKVSSSYLYKLKNNNLTVYKIFEAGEKIKKVETALYKKAIGEGKITSHKVKEVLTKEGVETLSETTVTEKDADVNAAKFFLEKRDSKNWGVAKTNDDDKPIININIGGYNEN